MSLVGSETLTRCYSAVPDSVPLARHELVQFALHAGATEDQAEAVRLSTSEALTNVVMHAYGEVGGRIHVSANLARGELWILIGDDGDGLRPHTDSPGLGVGLALVAQSSDGLTIVNRAGSGTEVRMRFNLHAGEDGAGQASPARVSVTSPASPRFSTTK
ncbi:MAG: ATP-binding protein [Actinomycetota bacterium]|nr:ATP-binding protein [Actinomycetota bacterium]